jgi:hypothetical protein
VSATSKPRTTRIKASECRYRHAIFDLSPYPVPDGGWGVEAWLLAALRYNRLIDTFLGVSAYCASERQAEPAGRGRPSVAAVYIAKGRSGENFVIPVLTAGGTLRVSNRLLANVVSVCRSRYPSLIPRPVAVQFVRDESGETIVMFALDEVDGEIRARDEKHYRLVPASEITADDLTAARRAGASQ